MNNHFSARVILRLSGTFLKVIKNDQDSVYSKSVDSDTSIRLKSDLFHLIEIRIFIFKKCTKN